MDQQTSAGSNGAHRKFYERLKGDLCEAVRIEVRYKTQDHDGMTRSDRNRKVGAPVPEAVVPEAGARLWCLFWAVSTFRTEGGRVPPSEVMAWLQLHGKRVATIEVPLLDAMDRQFCATMAEEMSSNLERLKERI